MCLRFQFCTHQRVCILYFLKKSQIRCTLMYIVHSMYCTLGAFNFQTLMGYKPRLIHFQKNS
jgi:hypothetical protein